MNTLKEYKHPNLGIRLDAGNAVLSMIFLVGGIALIAHSLNLQTNVGNYPASMIGGGVCAIVFAVVWYFVKGRALYFLPTESKVQFKSLHFDAVDLPVLMQLAENGRISDSKHLSAKEIGNVRLDIMKSADDCFAAIQVSQYTELMYVPQSEVRILNISEVEAMSKSITFK